MNNENYLQCRVIHGDIAQKSREEALQRFRKGDINVLIATDVAARGIDIPDVDLVLSLSYWRVAKHIVLIYISRLFNTLFLKELIPSSIERAERAGQGNQAKLLLSMMIVKPVF